MLLSSFKQHKAASEALQVLQHEFPPGGARREFKTAPKAQLMKRSIMQMLPKSSSSKTLQKSIENKRGLSRELDQTLKEGAHDMRFSYTLTKKIV
jgi:hypothetical protein